MDASVGLQLPLEIGAGDHSRTHKVMKNSSPHVSLIERDRKLALYLEQESTPQRNYRKVVDLRGKLSQ